MLRKFFLLLPRSFALPCLLLFFALSTLSACGGSAASRASLAGEPQSKAEGGQQIPPAANRPAPVASEPQAAEAAPKIQEQPASLPAAPSQTAASRVSAALASGAFSPESDAVDACWLPLMQRLQNDPKASPEVVRYFCSLPPYSADPMAEKVKELFTNAFLRKKRTPDDGKPKAPPSRIYHNVVTAATMQKCQDFLALHKAAFDAVEKKYPVPREALVALLFVETRLGTYVGKHNAFWSLACMAAADKPELVTPGLSGLPITKDHDAWLQSKLTDKSDWAYKELRALLAFCSTQDLDPHQMPGSVYGAIGICQFMPSNLLPYGDDGDGDGVVNLFSEPDAIFSAAKYLTKHGWSAGASIAQQRAVLKRYNNLTIYANTILALAESVRTGVVQTGPPDAAPAKGAGKKKPAGKK